MAIVDVIRTIFTRSGTLPLAEPADAEFGIVHAVLKPRGLVKTAGVIVSAWWVGEGPPAAVGSRVERRYADDGRWLAAEPAATDTSVGRSR